MKNDHSKEFFSIFPFHPYFHSMKSGLILAMLYFLSVLSACSSKDTSKNSLSEPKKKEFLIVPGEDEEFDAELIIKGEVLVAYSDCYQCHKEVDKAKGPSFSDIARRYPMNQTYIDLLANKVINGGSGTWGYPVMSQHPKLPLEEAKAMVIYILSLEKK